MWKLFVWCLSNSSKQLKSFEEEVVVVIDAFRDFFLIFTKEFEPYLFEDTDQPERLEEFKSDFVTGVTRLLL